MVLRLVILFFFVCFCSTINRIDAAGSGRAFPIVSENYIIEHFKYINRHIEWDHTNFLVDLSGLYANCKYVGTRDTMKVDKLTPEGDSIIGIVDYTNGDLADVNSVNDYLKKVVDRLMAEGRFNSQIRGAKRFGCSVRPGCSGQVTVGCLFSPGTPGIVIPRITREPSSPEPRTPKPPPRELTPPSVPPPRELPPPDMIAEPKALAFTPEQYEIAERIARNRWDHSHFLENMSGFETDCAMIGNIEWPFTKAQYFKEVLKTRYSGTYGYAANLGSTPDALDKILRKLKIVSSAKQVGCSLIPDCVYDRQLYVVVSCIYEEI